MGRRASNWREETKTDLFLLLLFASLLFSSPFLPCALLLRSILSLPSLLLPHTLFSLPLFWLSHFPPRNPMISAELRCACRSTRSIALECTRRRNGAASPLRDSHRTIVRGLLKKKKKEEFNNGFSFSSLFFSWKGRSKREKEYKWLVSMTSSHRRRNMSHYDVIKSFTVRFIRCWVDMRGGDGSRWNFPGIFPQTRFRVLGSSANHHWRSKNRTHIISKKIFV